MRLLFVVPLSVVAACSAEPELCDRLCVDAGFQNVEETSEGCFCSSGNGLGGSLTQDACEEYCLAVESSTEDAVVASTQGPDDSCLCGVAE
ncbi:MAG: hypothetical protein KTR31_08745 [Myxococcales bacterium]|nr:hypothetical protein [Myxococcales bacterium]